VKHGFDVVAVWVEDECAVVPGVVRPLAGRAVVAATSTECGLVKRRDRLAVGGLESQVNPGDQPVGLVHEQLIDVEVTVSLDEAVRPPEGGHDSAIKALAGLQIGDTKVNMIDEPAQVDLHDVGLLI